jgi:hypothetical protein
MNSTHTIRFSSVTSYQPIEAFEPEIHESTYGLLIRSEEKSRGIFEIIAYMLCILSAVISIYQFAQQSTVSPIAVNHGSISSSTPSGPVVRS